MSRPVDALPIVLTPAGAVLEALARTVAAHVPLDLHGAEPHPSSRTLPGLDLDARGVVARRDAGAPVGAAMVPAFDAYERLHGRVYREGPCGCGDCLSCEVQRMGRGIGANRAAWPGGDS